MGSFFCHDSVHYYPMAHVSGYFSETKFQFELAKKSFRFFLVVPCCKNQFHGTMAQICIFLITLKISFSSSKIFRFFYNFSNTKYFFSILFKKIFKRNASKILALLLSSFLKNHIHDLRFENLITNHKLFYIENVYSL